MNAGFPPTGGRKLGINKIQNRRWHRPPTFLRLRGGHALVLGS
jgi:hypothetical protein